MSELLGSFSTRNEAAGKEDSLPRKAHGQTPIRQSFAGGQTAPPRGTRADYPLALLPLHPRASVSPWSPSSPCSVPAVHGTLHGVHRLPGVAGASPTWIIWGPASDTTVFLLPQSGHPIGYRHKARSMMAQAPEAGVCSAAASTSAIYQLSNARDSGKSSTPTAVWARHPYSNAASIAGREAGLRSQKARRVRTSAAVSN